MKKVGKAKGLVLFLFCLISSMMFLSCGNNVNATKDASLSLDLTPLISSRAAANTVYTSPFEGTFYIELIAKSFSTTTSTYYYEYAPNVEEVSLALDGDNTYTTTILNVPIGEKIQLNLNIYSSKDLTTESLAAYGETTFAIEKTTSISLPMTICKYKVELGEVKFEASSNTDYITDESDYVLGDSIFGSIASITTSPVLDDVTYTWTAYNETTKKSYDLITERNGNETNEDDTTDSTIWFFFSPKTAGTYTFRVTATAVIDGKTYTVKNDFKTKKIGDPVVTKVVLNDAPTTYLLPATGTYTNTWQTVTTATGKTTYTTFTPTLSTPSAILTYSDYDENYESRTDTVEPIPESHITYGTGTPYATPTTPGVTTYTVTYGKATQTYDVTSYGIVLPTYKWSTSGTAADTNGEFNAGDDLTYSTTAATIDNTYLPPLNDSLSYSFSSPTANDSLDNTSFKEAILSNAPTGTHTLSMVIDNINIDDTTYRLTINDITSVTVHGGTITVTPTSGSNKTVTLSINKGTDKVTSINCLDKETDYIFTATCTTATASTVYTWYANGTDLNILTQTVSADHTTSSVTCTANTFVNAFSAIQIGENTLSVTVTEEGVIVGRATLTFTVTTK